MLGGHKFCGMRSGISTFRIRQFREPDAPRPHPVECEVIRVLLNIGQISHKQYVSIILTIHLNAGINKVKVCSSKCRPPPVELPKVETPGFIPPNLWPPNSPNLNPVDYKIWGLLQERIYKTSIKDVDELRRQIAEEWDKLNECIIDNAVAEWRKGERDFERVWLRVEDSLNTKREHLSFLTFCIWIFWPNSLKYCCFVQWKLVVLLSTMRVICYISWLQLYYAIQRIFIKYAIANHIPWKQIS